MTAPRSPLRRFRGPGAVWCLNVLQVTAAAVILVAVGDAPSPDARLHLPWIVLAATFAGAELCVVQVHVRRSTHCLTLGELPLVIGLVFCSPVEVATAWAVGAGLVIAASRPAAVRLWFNVTNFAFAAAIAGWVVQMFSGTADQAQLWFAAALGATVSSIVSALLIAVAMALSGDTLTVARVEAMVAMGVAVSVTNASLALATAIVLANEPLGGLLLIAPAGALFAAYRAYSSQHRKNLELKFLYDAARTLSEGGDGPAGLAGVLAMALETFHAEIAEVCVLVDGDQEAKRLTVDADGRVDVLVGINGAAAAQLRALVADDLGSHAIRNSDVGGALAQHLQVLGARDAIVAGMARESRLVGTIMVANRMGGGSFDEGEQHLFETLASHTGATLAHDRLEQRVDELSQARDRLFEQAFHDPLTGLPNRLLFLDRMTHALARRSGNVAALYIDLDDFKPINDTLGHEAGDALLCAVADRLRHTLRAADTPARLGGDEFAVLLVDIEPDHVEVVADRLLTAFAQPVDLGGGRTSPISASVGVALAASGTTTTQELVRDADAAMYVAKRGGKRGWAQHGSLRSAA